MPLFQLTVKITNKIVGFCADSASVNLGQRNGVVAKLMDAIYHIYRCTLYGKQFITVHSTIEKQKYPH